ncbi:hypothetical protein AVEN_147790-1, partial [Araneus ventricosus]
LTGRLWDSFNSARPRSIDGRLEATTSSGFPRPHRQGFGHCSWIYYAWAPYGGSSVKSGQKHGTLGPKQLGNPFHTIDPVQPIDRYIPQLQAPIISQNWYRFCFR